MKRLLLYIFIAVFCLAAIKAVRNAALPAHIKMARKVIKKLPDSRIKYALFESRPKYLLGDKLLEKKSKIVMNQNVTVTLDEPGYVICADLRPDYDWQHPALVIVFYPDSTDLPPIITKIKMPGLTLIDPKGDEIKGLTYTDL